MRATVLVDNLEHNGLKGEWGLSIYIEYRDKKILLDTGASGLFAENAQKTGVSLEKVDYGVLTHAHYDHSDGIRRRSSTCRIAAGKIAMQKNGYSANISASKKDYWRSIAGASSG